ncbi:MAG: MCE family protein [Deltaproteobacteria bacterium]|nr:MCE family protein [Deltaproteobacteria bacterium]
MDERALELRVGLVVLAAIAVLVGFVLLIGDFHFAKQYQIFVDFKFSGTIAPGAPVKISGVQIGRVESIEFIGSKPQQGSERLQTRLSVLIDEKAKDAIPEGTEFFISTAGILGEQYLEAVPGDRAGAPIAAGTTLRGVDTARTDLLIARMNAVLGAFSSLLSENRGLLENLAKAATGLTSNIDDLLKQKRGAITESIDNLAAMSKEGKAITEKLNAGLGSAEELRATVKNLQEIVTAVKAELPQMSDKTKRAMSEAEKALASVNAALDADKDRLKRTMANLETISTNAVAVTDDAKVLTKKMRRGEGSVGALLSDEDIYDDLKEMLRDLKQHPWKVIWRD